MGQTFLEERHYHYYQGATRTHWQAGTAAVQSAFLANRAKIPAGQMLPTPEGYRDSLEGGYSHYPATISFLANRAKIPVGQMPPLPEGYRDSLEGWAQLNASRVSNFHADEVPQLSTNGHQHHSPYVVTLQDQIQAHINALATLS
eukprot:scaffold31746_cov20-Tisochrysis_lutea.AAC.3